MATRDGHEWMQEHLVEDDGFPAGEQWDMHTADKLLILARYFPAFGQACRSAGAWYFVDAFAGHGHCDFGEIRTRGSTLLALEADPQFDKVISIEAGHEAAEALRHRTSGYGSRSLVVEGDCNVEIMPSIRQHVPREAPLVVLFDQTGVQLHWETVERVSAFRIGRYKTELLIFVNTPYLVRAANWPTHRSAQDASFPPGIPWRERVATLSDPQAKREAVASAYGEGLKHLLGYDTVFSRSVGPIEEDAGGRDRYHLVFATDNEAGEQIMANCFAKGYLGGLQKKLF